MSKTYPEMADDALESAAHFLTQSKNAAKDNLEEAAYHQSHNATQAALALARFGQGIRQGIEEDEDGDEDGDEDEDEDEDADDEEDDDDAEECDE